MLAAFGQSVLWQTRYFRLEKFARLSTPCLVAMFLSDCLPAYHLLCLHGEHWQARTRVLVWICSSICQSYIGRWGIRVALSTHATARKTNFMTSGWDLWEYSAGFGYGAYVWCCIDLGFCILSFGFYRGWLMDIPFVLLYE